jgi:protein TonB
MRGFTKIAMVVVIALGVNLAMFTTIEFMVRLGEIRLNDATDFQIANFIRVPEQTREVRSRRDPKAPQKPAQEMQQEFQQLSQASNMGTAGSLAVEMPDIEFDFGSDIQMVRELTPLVRIPADYPLTALSRSIEGFVVFRFTVTETGTVADPEILMSEPPGVFDRAAERALLKWKFQPQVVEGKAVPVTTFTRLVFKIARDEPEEEA